MKKHFIITLAFLINFSILVNSQTVKLYPIENNGVYYYRNSSGKIYKPKFTSARKFSEGLAAVETKSKFGYINSKVKFAISPQYEAAGDFKEGLAYVKYNKKYGYINKSGEVIISFKYDYAGNFKNGFAIVRNISFNTKVAGFSITTGIIDTNGKLLGGKWFTEVQDFKNGYYLVNIEKDFFKLYKNDTIEEIKEYTEDISLNSGSIDTAALYPGGEKALLVFIASYVKYPNVAKEKEKQGTVYVQFEISKKGKVENVKIAKSICPSLDEAAMKVIRRMGVWTPGMHKGQIVRSTYMVPVMFRLY